MRRQTIIWINGLLRLITGLIILFTALSAVMDESSDRAWWMYIASFIAFLIGIALLITGAEKMGNAELPENQT